MTTTTTLRPLTAHQRWTVRRWLVDDVTPVLLPMIGVDAGLDHPWTGWPVEYARGRVARLWQQLRDRGRHPDYAADALGALGRALEATDVEQVEQALQLAQRAISHCADHPTIRQSAPDRRRRWERDLAALLATPEPQIAPVGVSEIARMAGARPDTVDEWRRRHHDFPQPRWHVGGRPAWEAGDVERWLAATGRSYTAYREMFPA